MIAYILIRLLNVHMISLKTESDILKEVANSVRSHRVALRWRQDDLATRSGLSIATVRRFERSGQIGFQGLAKLLVSLGLADAFLAAFTPPSAAPASIDAFLKASSSRRARRRVRIKG